MSKFAEIYSEIFIKVVAFILWETGAKIVGIETSFLLEFLYLFFILCSIRKGKK